MVSGISRLFFIASLTDVIDSVLRSELEVSYR